MAVETLPILPSRDLVETATFHAALGFEESGHRPESYLVLVHPVGVELHFFWSPRHSSRANDHGAYVRFDNAAEVDTLHAAWAALDLGAGEVTAPVDTEYGLREFALLDRLRNLVRIGGFLASQPSK